MSKIPVRPPGFEQPVKTIKVSFKWSAKAKKSLVEIVGQFPELVGAAACVVDQMSLNQKLAWNSIHGLYDSDMEWYELPCKMLEIISEVIIETR